MGNTLDGCRDRCHNPVLAYLHHNRSSLSLEVVSMTVVVLVAHQGLGHPRRRRRRRVIVVVIAIP